MSSLVPVVGRHWDAPTAYEIVLASVPGAALSIAQPSSVGAAQSTTGPAPPASVARRDSNLIVKRREGLPLVAQTATLIARARVPIRARLLILERSSAYVPVVTTSQVARAPVARLRKPWAVWTAKSHLVAITGFRTGTAEICATAIGF
jgi:hypothetical protein